MLHSPQINSDGDVAMSDRIETNPALIEWLRDYEEQPWRRYTSGLKERGELVNVAGVMVDALYPAQQEDDESDDENSSKNAADVHKNLRCLN